MTLAFTPPPRTDSPLSRLDPRWKLAAIALAATAAAVVRTPHAAAAALVGACVLAVLGRLPWRWWAARVAPAVLFVAVFALPLAFTARGAETAVVLVCKAAALVTLALVLLATAPLDATLKAAHALHAPGLLVQLTLLSYRYLFLLADELGRLRIALRLRGYRNRANLHSYRTVGAVTGALLVRGWERAERVGQAMRCRGFDGRFRSLTAFRTAAADVVLFVAVVAVAAGVCMLDWVVYFRSGGAFLSADPAIVVRDLTYAYPRGPTALDGVSFAVAAGESVGLIGPNGAGKTSLFLCLAGVIAPRAEALLVGGLDPRDPAQRRRLPACVGVVFQNSDDQLFNATVADDVAFGPLNLGLPPDEVRRRTAEALAAVALTGLEERPPFHLSGGEKRRVALAGVLAMRPQVLLLDEPSLHLDPRGRREFIRLLNGLPGTKVIASHDLELILQTCPRVLLLDGGRLIADGSARTLLADAGLMEKHGLEAPYSLRAIR